MAVVLTVAAGQLLLSLSYFRGLQQSFIWFA
jgi:hypothetical protein